MTLSIFKLTSLVFIVATVIANPAFAKVIKPWQDLHYKRTTDTDSIQVNSGRYVDFNLQTINDYVVDQTAASQSIEIDLPLPDGKVASYRLNTNTTMSTELAAKYPNIRSYSGYEIDDNNNRGSFSLTPNGFYGYYYHNGEWLMLDPVNKQSSVHVSYRKVNAQSQELNFVEYRLKQTQLKLRVNNKVLNRTPIVGTELRTYRMAVSASGEYTAFHSGNNAPNVADAMEAIVVLMNRVNEIFERDVAIRFSLIGNNDQLIFTDGNTDPFDNASSNDLSVNQITIDNIIGSENYDIGHLVTTGGGGVAVPAVCENGFKAQGLTGLPFPEGDVFLIDFVAHELGHQLGANHSYNGTTDICGDQRVQSAAWEPGSGSTIMGYAQLCGEEDLQPNADALFHIGSIEEMLSFTARPQNTCGTLSSLNNAIPVADAGFDVIVPANTPMLLSGTGSDDDGDNLTYAWEQFDLGAPSNNREEISIDDGTRPLFRTFLPQSQAQRYLPRLEDIIDGETILGEALPSTNRTLTFRLTVRDGRGGVDSDTRIINTINQAGPFSVTAPTASTQWVNGETQTISWNIANTNQAPISCSNVDILLSTDSGVNFNRFIARNVSNNGTYSFVPSITATSAARVMVLCSNNIFFNINVGDFSITGQPTGGSLEIVPDFGLVPASDPTQPIEPSPPPAPIEPVAPIASLSVFVTKGPITGANCVLQNDSGTTVASADGDSNEGIANFSDLTTTGIFTISCTGGSYVDEVTNQTVVAPNLELNSRASVTTGDNNSVVVSPFTEIAFQLALASGDLTNFDAQAQILADNLQISDINFATDRPQNGDNYTIALMAFSQIVADVSSNVPTEQDLLNTLNSFVTAGQLDSVAVAGVVQNIEDIVSPPVTPPTPPPVTPTTPTATSSGGGSMPLLTLLLLFSSLLLAACSNRASNYTPNNERTTKVQTDIDALQWVKNVDINAKIQQALDTDNFQLLALAQRATIIPGINASRVEQAKSLCGINYVKGIGDLFHKDSEYRQLRKQATDYAKRYNQRMFEHCLTKRVNAYK